MARTSKRRPPQKGPPIEEFVAMLPELYYSVNRVLEDCTPSFSKKVGVALWALDASTNLDNAGRFLMTRDLVSTFCDWFVVNKKSANAQVSKVKDDLFGLDYIRIEGGKGHIHLNEKGEKAVRGMLAKAKEVVEATVGVLNPEEQLILADIARRLIASRRKPPIPERSAKSSLQMELPAS